VLVAVEMVVVVRAEERRATSGCFRALGGLGSARLSAPCFNFIPRRHSRCRMASSALVLAATHAQPTPVSLLDVDSCIAHLDWGRWLAGERAVNWLVCSP